MCEHKPEWKGNFFRCNKCFKVFVNSIPDYKKEYDYAFT